MSRFSLLRVWSYFFTVLVFLLPFPIYVGMSRYRGEEGLLYFSCLSVALVLGALLWAVFINRLFLPGMVRGRVYGKSAILMFVQCYLAIEIIIWFGLAWDRQLPQSAKDAAGHLAWGLVLHIWMFPYSLPLFLLCLFANGAMLKFLHQKRDYLPEAL